jgi:nucleoid DNA-binding protein
MATRTKSPATPKAAASATRRTATAKAKPTTAAPPKAVAELASEPEAEGVEASPLATDRAKRSDLLDAVAERSALRRGDLRVAMDLVLEELGKLLDAGDEVVVPPLGKLSVKKRVARDGGDMLTVKLKRLPGDGGKDDPDT